MKKILLASVALFGFAGAASAADLPMRSAPPAPIVAAAPIFTWTGFYVGGQVGYGWNTGDNDFAVPAGVTVDGVPFTGFGGDDGDGFLAGVHAGYNYQIGSFVVGLEGDIEGVFGDDDDDFDGVFEDDAGNPIVVSIPGTSIDWQGSIRARAGFAFDRALIYATGGFAFAGLSDGIGDADDDTLTGWTLGAGLEYAFTNNLTTRLEYRYTSFDGDNIVFDGEDVGESEVDFHTVRVGLSYKFGTY
ncbi:outer membrane protein [Microvirga pakistanensis]|uniref:outer membrane protein n=1 Tax=Microvirga pakistanensis TaxID=1682650 RepID=UPI001069B08D|nr:outer membrane protein [Microvirga pakistanensis]